ncbi:MAG: hypothetical protein RI967_92 [Planctomycetota bacterium]
MNALTNAAAPIESRAGRALKRTRGHALSGTQTIAWWSAALPLLAAFSATASAPPTTEPPPPEKASTADLVDLAPLDAVGAPCWSELGARRIYFAHASVGRNILDGVEEILRERPSIGLAVASWRAFDESDPERPHGNGASDETQRAGGGRDGARGTPKSGVQERDKEREKERDREHAPNADAARRAGQDGNADEGGRRIARAFRTPALVHGPAGANGSLDAKIDGFERMLRSREGDGVDLAILKLCYADIGRGTDVDALFTRYADAVERVKRERPEIRFIHCTVPLRAAGHGAKAAIKRLVGAGENAANARRGRFNELVRRRYAREEILDIADIESHAPDGTATTVEYDGVKWPCLADDYTDDGGHLNRHGRLLVAREMLLALSRTCSASPIPTTTAGAETGSRRGDAEPGSQ